MCNHTQKQKSNLSIFYISMIALGIAAGLTDYKILHDLGLAISKIFVSIFRIISLPIIFLSIISTIVSQNSDSRSKKIFNKVILYTLLTTIVAAIIACIIYLIVRPENVQFNYNIPAPNIETSYLKFIQKLIPNNLITPFIEYNIIMVLIFAKVIASSIMLLPNENNKKIVIGFFIGLHSIFGIITKSIVRFLPIGFFGFISTTIIEIRAGVDISGLWKFLFVIISANFIQGFLFLPILLKANGIAPFDSMKKMMPALGSVDIYFSHK